MKRRKSMVASLLAMGTVQAVADNKITVAFGNNSSTDKQVLEKQEWRDLIETTLREFYKVAARIEFVIDVTVESSQPARQKTVPQKVNADDLLAADPELKRMVEQIDGEIIDRRKTDD